MSDQTAGGVGNSIKQLFSPPVLAALRYLLTAVSPLLAIVGVVALKPEQIDHIIAAAQQIGVVIGALAAFLGVAAPVLAGIWGTLKSTDKSNIQRTAEIATGQASPVAEDAQKAIITATAAIAQDKSIPKSDDAKDALIAATIGLDEVQTIVTDKKTADASPSGSVVAAEEVHITPKAS